ncbi:sensor histidine kinase [Streptomyces justiciae]|uniref:sensor histidine kinase n=1 Tax=Streptomyces justiciae TaxID=2780140 RepID=UPI002118D0EA|nr:sensor histidine kinase [Streptomyces justiciae]MCW8382227.1 histidine kinase [Streptomyces justiciae]
MRHLMETLPRWRLRHPWLTDVLLVVLVAVPPVIREQPGWRPVWVQITVYGAFVLPLLWRRRRPVLAAVVVTAAFWAQYLGHVWGQEPGRGVIALAAVFYTLVVRGLRRQAAVTAVCAASCVLLWVPDWLTATAGSDRNVWFTPASVIFWLTASWTLGAYVRARRALLAEFARRAELTESRRVALARAAAAEERARIAREIHDVLAHGVTLMVLNAEGARLARHTDPTATDRALAVIGATGRDALGELRRLLDVLRSDEPAAHGLDDLPGLVACCPADATLELLGERAGLPEEVVEDAYRIVQEALTNVAKHAAPGARAQVRLDLGEPGPDRRVHVHVTNTAGSGDVRRTLPPSSGRGLAGMRERAARHAGTVEAGPTPDGGYRVAAVLRPLPSTAVVS